MNVSNSARAFFNGTNPYTGCSLPSPECPSYTNSYPASSASYAAPPAPTPAPPPPPPDPQEVLSPLYQASQELAQARTKLGNLRQSWSHIGSEVGAANRTAGHAESDVYPAENDTEHEDYSSVGNWANRNLDQVLRTMDGLRWNNSTPTTILADVKSHVQNAYSYLQSVPGERLANPWRHTQLMQDINNFPSKIYRLEQVQQQLEWKLSQCSCNVHKAQGAVNGIAMDGPGKNVADKARDARYALRDVQQQLSDVESHMRYSESDLSQMESLLASAEQTVQTVSQEYEYKWRTADNRSY